MPTKHCKLILLDEVNCIFDGLSTDHKIYFYEKYGIFTKGYFFNPKYQLGTWDGKIRFFHNTGKTFINMLDDIIPRVIQLGYTIDIDDKRLTQKIQPPLVTKDFFSYINNDQGQPWVFRDYQVDAINSLITNNGGMALCATGSGKTSMCAALAKVYELAGNIRSIIIVPDKTLTDQTKEEYEFFGLDVGEYSGSSKDLDHQHVIATWQTLKNMPNVIQDFDMFITDEAHGARGPVLNTLLVKYGKGIQYRFGCTGTLPEEECDRYSVKTAIGAVQYEVPASLLIEQGHLSKIEIDIIQMNVNLKTQYEQFKIDVRDDAELSLISYSRFKESYFPDFAAEKAFLHSEKIRIAWISNYLESFRLLSKGNVLCLVNGIAFGKKLKKQIPNSVFLHGSDKTEVRKEIYDSFSNNDDLIVIATVNIAGTGLNIKRIFNLILVDLGKSYIRVLQSIGRGLRTAHDKNFVYVGDVCSDLKYSRKHMHDRIKFYNDAKYPNKKRLVDY